MIKARGNKRDSSTIIHFLKNVDMTIFYFINVQNGERNGN